MHAVIKATFADWRTVKGRAVLQLICEVPVEDTKRVLDTLGAPVPGSDIWVAVARLVDNGGGSTEPPVDAGGEDASVPAQPVAPAKRRWSEMSRAQRAGMLCEDAEFQRWLFHQYDVRLAPDKPFEDMAAETVRFVCSVASRSQLDHPSKAPAWDALEARFMQATGRMAVDR